MPILTNFDHFLLQMQLLQCNVDCNYLLIPIALIKCKGGHSTVFRGIQPNIQKDMQKLRILGRRQFVVATNT